MLEAIEIQGFRCFHQFKIEGLKRINLIGGKNSVGKSALLEAIRLYQQPGLEGILDILEWRDEVPAGHAVWTREMIDPLFYDVGRNASRPRIRLRGDRTLELNVAWHRWNQDGTWKLEEAADSIARDPTLKQVLRFEYPNSGGPYYFLPLDGSLEIDSPTSGTRRAERIFLRYANASERPTIYVRSDALDSDSMSELYEKVAATPIEEEVNKMMRWIIPDSERLLTKGSGDRRTLYLKRRTATRPEPLKRFGDGALRLAALALAIANTPDGYCLIDEIENGIHHELFDHIWEKLAIMSKNLNVQVFATTHSKDCIDAFERAYRLSDFDACFYRLERAGDGIGAVRLDHQSFFSVVAGQEHEVR